MYTYAGYIYIYLFLRCIKVAKRIKEMYSYVCPDIAKEFAKYDQEPSKWIKQYGFQHSVTKKVG